MPRVKIASPASSNLKCLAVYRLSDRVMVAMYAADASAEHSIRATIAKVLDANAHDKHPRLTVTDREHGQIHYETDSAAMFLAVTTAYPQRVAFRAISELRARFTGGLGDALQTALEGGLSRSSRPLMSELCGRFADETKVDKALEVMQQVDDVKGIMGEAIQSLLNTQENLEVLEERGEVLKEQARTFQKTSRTVAQVQRRQNTKFLSYSCIILVVLIIVATVPLVLYYWADIVAFLSGALPPDGNGATLLILTTMPAARILPAGQR